MPWNDTDVPLGHLITFRSFGTWLHGDRRGSVDRYHNRFKSPYVPPNESRLERSERALRSKPCILNARQRKSVDDAIREVCEHRQWTLYAHNVRTNHVHIVVSIGTADPDRALNAFKAYATRRMRKDGNWREPQSPWVDKGSKRRLWNERSLARAIDYVLYDQGADPSEFD